MRQWLHSSRGDEEERAGLLGEGEREASSFSASEQFSNLKEQAKSRLGLGPREPPPPPGCCPELSYTQRLIGFTFCFLLGCLLSITSLGSFTGVILGNPVPFAFKYSLGNLLSLCSYCFLVGPSRQCAGMFAIERRFSTLLYLGSLAATLYTVFWLRSYLLTLACILVQAVAMVYYALSYLPYGQTMMRRALGC